MLFDDFGGFAALIPLIEKLEGELARLAAQSHYYVRALNIIYAP